jgi:hypothetical protein
MAAVTFTVSLGRVEKHGKARAIQLFNQLPPMLVLVLDPRRWPAKKEKKDENEHEHEDEYDFRGVILSLLPSGWRGYHW